MSTQSRPEQSPVKREKSKSARPMINRLVEKKLIHEVSLQEYKSKVRKVYDGPKGAFLAAASMLSLHTPLGERLFSTSRFSLRGAKQILDVGSGAGQIAKHLIKYSDPDAGITCFDLSYEMLRRARARMKSDRPVYMAADLSHLPFADATFDCVTCGFVLEHLPDPKIGLAELARVMSPGGRMLLLTTEDSFSGAFTSYIWYCRTYNRRELLQTCEQVGLRLKSELWYTRMHKAFAPAASASNWNASKVRATPGPIGMTAKTVRRVGDAAESA
ncbi:MAG: class I SAM-dependent methyltransferase [Pirellulales bacterium]